MLKTKYLALLFVGFAIGCGGQGVGTSASNNTTVMPLDAPRQANALYTEKNDSPGADKAKAGVANSATAGLPPAIRHAGFDYFGLDRNAPVEYTVTVSGEKSSKTGSQQIGFIGLSEGVATFTVTRTGALERLGAKDTLLVDAKGVYTLDSTAYKLSHRKIELPAKLAKGTKWQESVKVIATDGSEAEDVSNSRAKGFEKLKLPSGKQEALVVESTGMTKVAGKVATNETKSWYVKGLGLAKAVVKVKLGKTTQTTTIEIATPAKKK